MKTKRFLLTLATGAAFTLGTSLPSAYAQDPNTPPPPPAGGEGRHRGPGGPLEHFIHELNLTPEQQSQIQPILESGKPQLQSIHEETAKKMKAVMDDMKARIRPLLTPEQQAKLDAMKAPEQGPGQWRRQGPEKGRGKPFAKGPERDAEAPRKERGKEEAPRHEGPGGPGKRNLVDRLTEDLNLTPDQKAKVEAIAKANRPKMEELHNDTALAPRERHEKLKALMDETEAQIRPLLTPDQVKKLEALKAERQAHAKKEGAPKPQ
jgi:Spy/CpxP family protein refolding chaperone